MADTITDARTLVDDATDDANYVGSTSPADNTDIKIVGASSIGDQMNDTTRYVMFDAGTVQSGWANNTFYIWINCGIVGLLATKASSGFTIRFAGATVSDYFEVNVGGSDSWPTAIEGGWVQFVVDIEEAHTLATGSTGGTGGTKPTTAQIQHVGYSAITATVMTKVGDNTWIDEIRRLPAGDPGIIVQGRSGGATAWTSANIFTELGVEAGTFVEGAAGTYVLRTPIQFGVDDTVTHLFEDTNQIWLWDEQEFITDDYYFLEAIGNSGGTTDIKFGLKSGSGDDATGSQGFTIAAASTGFTWAMTFNDVDLDSANFYGCSFIHGGAFLFNDVAVSCISTLYVDCVSALITGSEQLRISVINAATADGVAYMTTDDLVNIVFSSFEFSDGHGIELTTPIDTAQPSKGNKYTSYLGTPGDNLVASSGSNDAAIYNNQAGDITISVSNDGDTPSIRNGASATTVVQNAVNVTLSNLVIGSQILIYETDTPANVIMDLVSDAVSETASYPYLSDTDITVVVRHSSMSPRYLPYIALGEVISTGFSLAVSQNLDPIAAGVISSAPTYDSNTFTSIASSTSWVANSPQPTVQKLMLAFLVSDGTQTVATGSTTGSPSSIPTDWVEVQSGVAKTGGTDCSGYLFYKFSDGSEPSTYTWTWSGATAGYADIVVLDNVDQSSPVDTSTITTTTAAQTQVVLAEITTDTDNELLVAMTGTDEDATESSYWSSPMISGWTQRVNAESTTFEQCGVATVVQVSAGASGAKTATIATAADGIVGFLVGVRGQ